MASDTGNLMASVSDSSYYRIASEKFSGEREKGLNESDESISLIQMGSDTSNLINGKSAQGLNVNEARARALTVAVEDLKSRPRLMPLFEMLG